MKTKKKFWDKPVVLLITTILLASAFIGLGQAIGYIMFLPLLLINGDGLSFAAMYLTFAGIWIVTLLYMRIFKSNRPIFKAMGTKAAGNNWKTALLLGIPAGLGINLACGLIAALCGDIKLVFNEFNIGLIILFIVAIAIQGGAEELIARVFIYQRMMKAFPSKPWVAIAVNSLFFGAMHLMNPGITFLSVVNLILSGLMFSLMIYYFDSFWAAVVAHQSWNFCQSILLGLPNSGNVSQYSIFKLGAASETSGFAYNVGFGIEGTVLANLMILAACAVLFAVGRKRNRKPIDVWNYTEKTT